jgi:hypothetical protein
MVVDGIARGSSSNFGTFQKYLRCRMYLHKQDGGNGDISGWDTEEAKGKDEGD